jgi:hypothetical protein
MSEAGAEVEIGQARARAREREATRTRQPRASRQRQSESASERRPQRAAGVPSPRDRGRPQRAAGGSNTRVAYLAVDLQRARPCKAQCKVHISYAPHENRSELGLAAWCLSSWWCAL